MEISQTSPQELIRESIGERLIRFFWGDDLFISYARSDSTDYVKAIAKACQDTRITPYFDVLGTPPGKELPAPLVRRILRSSTFLVIASPAAALSESVEKEVRLFARTGRDLYTIDVAGHRSTASWSDAARGVVQRTDTLDGLTEGKPGIAMLRDLIDGLRFVSRNERLKRVGILFTALLFVAALATAVLAVRASALKSEVSDASSKLAALKETNAGLASKNGDLAAANLQAAKDLTLASKAVADEQKKAASLSLASKSSAMLRVDPGAALALAREAVMPLGKDAPAESVMAVRDAMRNTIARTIIKAGQGRAAFAMSGDRKRLAVADRSGMIRVFLVLDGAPREERLLHWGEGVYGVALDHDGRQVAAASSTRLAWWKRGESKPQEVDIDWAPEVLRFDPPGASVYWTDYGGSLTRWTGGGVPARIAADERASILALDEAGSRAIGASALGELLLLNLSSGTSRVFSWPAANGNEPCDPAAPGGDFCDDSGRDRRATACADSLPFRATIGDQVHLNRAGTRFLFTRPYLWLIGDAVDGKIVDYECHPMWGASERPIANGALNDAGDRLALAFDDGSAALYDLGVHRRLRLLNGHAETIGGFAFSSDDKFLLTRSADTTARVWDARQGGLVALLLGHSAVLGSYGNFFESVGLGAFDAKSSTVITGDYAGEVRFWSLDAEIRRTTGLEHLGRADSARFSPDGKWLIRWGVQMGTSMEVSRLQGLKVTRSLQSGRVLEAAIDDRGAVAAAEYGGRVRFWDAHGRSTGSFNTGRPIRTAAFSKGRLLAAVDAKGLLTVWSANGKKMASSPTMGPGRLQFHPEGALLAVFERDGAFLWEWQKDKRTKLVSDLLPGQAGVFTSSGKVLVTASDRVLAFWELNLTDRPLRPFATARCDAGSALAGSLDGDRVAAVCSENDLRLWNARGELLDDFPSLFPVAMSIQADGRMTWLDTRGQLRAETCETCGDVEELLRLSAARLPVILSRQ